MLAGLALLSLAPPPAGAGGWHAGERLVCSDCHTMHNSRDGAPMRYDGQSVPADRLLRASNALSLCIACHDGSKLEAPDVMGERSAAYEAVDPAAGSFPDATGSPSPSSHDLGGASVVPPDGSTAVVLTCLTCHDPHGNTRYRNLRESPSGTGRANGVQVVVTETAHADGTNPAAVYASSNLRYRAGIKAWCLDCHDRYDEFGGHSAEGTINGSYWTDYGYWFETRFEELPFPQRRVPVQTPTDTIVPSADDQVTCVSCHKAHGSPILPGRVPAANALIRADGESLDSTCNECHNK